MIEMKYDLTTKLWNNKKESFYRNKLFKPIKQKEKQCVSTVLAMLTGTKPENFQRKINTQNPVSWSDALLPYDMKLAYLPFDTRKLKFYMNELVSIDDLFLLGYYRPIGSDILNDPDKNGWVCGSHIVILHRDKIIDPKTGKVTNAYKHECNNHYTKRLFRVVPANYGRGL